ncbi:MAG: hypothetical protein WAS21_18285 [Geminicoccaceae bacterium]
MLPPAEEIRNALRELLGDRRFVATERNRRFLAYVVEEELQGRGLHIRAYTVAIEVFRRPADFDPNLDPIVRIEAGRLRQSLARYYEVLPATAAWRIVIPKGAYRPRFERLDPASPQGAPAPLATEPDGRHDLPAMVKKLADAFRKPVSVLPMALLGLAVVVALGVTVAFRGREPASVGIPAPSILVEPFTVLDSGADSARLALGLTRDVVDRLSRFRSFDIYGPAVYQHALDGGSVDFGRVAGRVHADYVVEGTLRRTADRIVVNVQLKEQATGRYLWTYRADNTFAVERIFASLLDIASQIATTLGQPLGIINRAEWLQRQPHSIGTYQCVLQAHEYYRSIDPLGHAAARDCLEQAIATDPNYAAAWVMLAWVYLDEARYRLNPRPELYDAETKAREAVNRALALDPEQEMALDALSVLQFRAGNMAAFRTTGQKMLALNPNDPDLAADFGARLAFTGDWETGMPLVHRAIDLAVEPPGTYYMVLAWDHYRQRDHQAALREAEKIKMPEFQLAVLTRAAIYGQLGMQQEATAALGDLRRLRSDLADDPRPWLLGLHFEPGFAEQLAEGVRAAGRLGS